MTKCDACGQKWPLLKVLQRTFTMHAGMECPHCHEKQYIKNDWKRIVIPLMILLVVPILLFTVEMNISVFLLIFSIAAFLSLFYMIFSLRLSSLEEWNQR